MTAIFNCSGCQLRERGESKLESHSKAQYMFYIFYYLRGKVYSKQQKNVEFIRSSTLLTYLPKKETNSTKSENQSNRILLFSVLVQ